MTRPITEPRSVSEMNSLSSDNSLLLLAQRRESASRSGLVEALCTQGRFQEALDINLDPEKEQDIHRLIKAEAEPDDARCDCRYNLDEADYTRNPKATAILRQGKNYLGQYKFWSSKYNCIVNAQRCLVCGHTNAVPFEIVPEGFIPKKGDEE